MPGASLMGVTEESARPAVGSWPHAGGALAPAEMSACPLVPLLPPTFQEPSLSMVSRCVLAVLMTTATPELRVMLLVSVLSATPVTPVTGVVECWVSATPLVA
ncbi:MAG TPA: hypothetical protein VGK73_05760, partial [Polyangiaceae bacterium]